MRKIFVVENPGSEKMSGSTTLASPLHMYMLCVCVCVWKNLAMASKAEGGSTDLEGVARSTPRSSRRWGEAGRSTVRRCGEPPLRGLRPLEYRCQSNGRPAYSYNISTHPSRRPPPLPREPVAPSSPPVVVPRTSRRQLFTGAVCFLE